MFAKITQAVTAACAVAAVLISIYTAVQVNIVHVTINSRMSELLELTQSASKAEGLKQGRDEKK